jgi:FkbM family methyltransferase
MMNFSGVSDVSLIGKLLRFPLRLIPKTAVVPVLQGKLKGKRWIAGSCNHGCWLGSFEYEKQTLFSNTVTPGSVVYDVGANVGFYTLLASELVGAMGSVIGFEPNPQNLPLLRRHLHLNHCANVTVIEAAVADRKGRASFVNTTSTTGRLAPKGDFEVSVVGLDELIAEGVIPVADFIKMDIEGGEVLALQGARRLLTTHHPMIFLATHGRDVHKFCCDFLRQCGYSLQAITGKTIEDTDEIFAYPAFSAQHMAARA